MLSSRAEQWESVLQHANGFCRKELLLRYGISIGLRLKKQKEELSALGKVFVHPCDVTDKVTIGTLVKTARKEMGRIDILVNNAGYVSGGDFLERPVKNWEKTIDVNLNALRVYDV